MRRLLALALVLALAAAITAMPRAAAGVDGDLDTFAAAVDDLADEALDTSAVLSERPTPLGDTVELVIALGDLRTTVARVAAAGMPVADHLATGRLSAAQAADALEPPVRALAAAAQELVGVSQATSPGPGGDGAAEEAQPSPVDLLAPAVQLLGRTLQALEPALEVLRPVIEPLAPVIDPACGQLPGVVFLALGLVPALAPVPLPTLPESPAVLAGSVLSPVFLLCASLPMPAEDAPADGEPGDGTAGDGASLGTADGPPAPPPPRQLTGGGSVSSGLPRSPTGAASTAAIRTPGGDTEAAALPSPPAPTGGGQSRVVTGMPLLPVDHDGEATGIALLVLAAAAVTAAVMVSLRRRRGLTDWTIPVAAGTGVGAIAAGAMAWNGAAEQLAPWAQMPYVISGGMTAFVLGVVAITLAVAGPLARIAGRR